MQNHKEPKKVWSEIAAKANEILREKEMTPNSLKELAEIDYYAARRMLLDGISSQTANAMKVCIKLGLVKDNAKVQTFSLADVQQALNDCWSGEAAQADLLIKMIKSTSNLKISFHQ